MIERLTDKDVEWIIDSLYLIREESPHYSDRTADETHTRSCFGRMLDNPNFIGIKYGHMGFMLGAMADAWYSPDLIAYEELLYVSPDHRGSSVAIRLVKEFVKIAEQASCTKVIAGATTDINDAGVLKLYHRCGFVRSGHLMVRKLV